MNKSTYDSLQTPLHSAAPALANYHESLLEQELWTRSGLTPHDRSLVTLSALIARNQQAGMEYFISQALQKGVTPDEIAETITHLAFYCGFGNAFTAVTAAERVFKQQGIDAKHLPGKNVTLLAIDTQMEATRQKFVAGEFSSVSPGVVKYTETPLFREVWLRPGLSPKNRSMITVSALIAGGQTAQLRAHLLRGISNGITKAEGEEMLTQLAFYAGWPNIFSAMPVFKAAFTDK